LMSKVCMGEDDPIEIAHMTPSNVAGIHISPSICLSQTRPM